jgi:hypothetical protein
MISIGKWGFICDPHFLECLIKKWGDVFNMIVDVLKLFDLRFLSFEGGYL